MKSFDKDANFRRVGYHVSNVELLRMLVLWEKHDEIKMPEWEWLRLVARCAGYITPFRNERGAYALRKLVALKVAEDEHPDTIVAAIAEQALYWAYVKRGMAFKFEGQTRCSPSRYATFKDAEFSEVEALITPLLKEYIIKCQVSAECTDQLAKEALVIALASNPHFERSDEFHTISEIAWSRHVDRFVEQWSIDHNTNPLNIFKVPTLVTS